MAGSWARPRSCSPSKLRCSSACSDLVWKSAQTCSTAPSRARFLTNNSFPKQSATLHKVTPAALFHLHTALAKDELPALPPLQQQRFPDWQLRGCLGRHSCRQKAKSALHYACSKRGWMESSSLQLGNGYEPAPHPDSSFALPSKRCLQQAYREAYGRAWSQLTHSPPVCQGEVHPSARC